MSVTTPIGTLQFTLRASRTINDHFGNFLSATQRIASFDFAAYPVVVAAGLSKTVKEVEEHVFAAGMQDLQKSLIEYLELLANGGKPWKPEMEGDKKGEG